MIDMSAPVPWTAIAQVLASVIGFFFVGYQLLLLGRNTRGSAQDRLYAHYMEVCKLFMQNPHLRPYFYDNMLVPADDPKLRAEVDAMCEAIWGLVEHFGRAEVQPSQRRVERMLAPLCARASGEEQRTHKVLQPEPKLVHAGSTRDVAGDWPSTATLGTRSTGCFCAQR